MKYFYLFISFYLFLLAQVFSKSLLVKATVVSITNDTTTVYLIDKKWKTTPTVFQASLTQDGKSNIELRPISVKEIRIDSGDYYIRAVVHVDMIYSIGTNVTKVHSTDSSRIDTLFFRVLMQGPLDLYLYTDINNKDHFFVNEHKTGFTELIDKNISSNYLNLESSLEYLVHISSFQEQLKILMKDCPSVTSKINSVDYKEKQLLKLFLEYTTCIKESNTYVSPVKTAKTMISFVAGVSNTKIQFIGKETSMAVHTSSYMHLSSFPVSTDPVIGFKFIFPITRADDKISFHSSILWWNYNTKSNYMDGSENEYFVHLNANYAKLVLGPAYKFNVGRLQVFASTGLIFMLLVHIVNDVHVEYGDLTARPIGSPTYYDGDAYYHPAIFDGGYYGSLGVALNRFTFEARYNRSKGMASSTGMKTPVYSFEFLLSYNLVK